MQAMTDKKRDFETACAAAVKVRNFTEAAKAAAGAADGAEILASRTTGIVSEAYTKEVRSWRDLAKKLEGRKNGTPPSERSSADGATSDGGEWLVAEKPGITFDDIAGMEDAKYAAWGTDGMRWGELAEGRIVLVDHTDTRASFRNLKIREL